MNTPTETPKFDRSPEFFVAEVAHQWVSSIDRTSGEPEIYVSKGQKVDPEGGFFHDILEIRVTRKMEKVEDEAPKMENVVKMS